jgi:hypothetical protein
MGIFDVCYFPHSVLVFNGLTWIVSSPPLVLKSTLANPSFKHENLSVSKFDLKHMLLTVYSFYL